MCPPVAGFKVPADTLQLLEFAEIALLQPSV